MQVQEDIHRLTGGIVNFYLIEEGGKLVQVAERARTSAPAAVWVHQADKGLAKGEKPGRNDGRTTSYLLRGAFYRTLFSLARRGATRIVPVKEVSTFADGETLDLPGRPRVVHAPGHTPGSTAALPGVWPGPQVMPSGLNRDTPQAIRSLDVLDGLPAEVLLPGHGEPWTGGAAEAVRQARAAGPS